MRNIHVKNVRFSLLFHIKCEYFNSNEYYHLKMNSLYLWFDNPYILWDEKVDKIIPINRVIIHFG